MAPVNSSAGDGDVHPIRLLDLDAQRRRLGDRIERAIQQVIEHGQFILGPEVEELETELAGRCGGGHVVSCSSGTDALLLGLMSWAVGPGDAVFVPAFTFAASAEMVALVGATPVFVDVQLDTFDMEPTSLKDAVASLDGTGLTPRGVIVVDLFGQPAVYDLLEEVARDHGLWVLADAAQSFGAALHGQLVGTHGDATVTSFFPAKPLGCYGDGGAIITADRRRADLLRSLRTHGQGESRYEHVRIGINGRLDSVQAAVLIQKLAVFAEEIEARRRIAARYTAELADVVVVPQIRAGATSVWAQYTIRVDHRDELARQLLARGVPTAVHYPAALHRSAAFEQFPTSPGGLPISEALARTVLSLPLHPYLTEEQQGRVIRELRSAVEAREPAVGR